MFNFDEQQVRFWIETMNFTHADVVQRLEAIDGPRRGLSVISLRRFCKTNNISSRSKITDTELQRQVAEVIENQTGIVGGYRSIKACLEANNMKKVAEKRIRRTLLAIDGGVVEARRGVVRLRTNPQRYFGLYFGHNLHMDQNEKLVDYKIVIVAAIDGHSSFIFDAAVMPKKNNLEIYEKLYRPIVQEYGLFDRLIVDHGGEFVLSIIMQQWYWMRINPEINEKKTFLQTKSTLNTRIERFWVESNQRVGYPVKMAFLQLEAMNLASAEIPYQLYSMSVVGQWIVKFGLDVTIRYMNNRFIRGRGKPKTIMQESYNAVQLNATEDVGRAHAIYRLTTGNTLTEQTEVETDLLQDCPELRLQRDRIFNNVFVPIIGDQAFVYGRLINDVYRPFQSLVLAHIWLSEYLYSHNFNGV